MQEKANNSCVPFGAVFREEMICHDLIIQRIMDSLYIYVCILNNKRGFRNSLELHCLAGISLEAAPFYLKEV